MDSRMMKRQNMSHNPTTMLKYKETWKQWQKWSEKWNEGEKHEKMIKNKKILEIFTKHFPMRKFEIFELLSTECIKKRKLRSSFVYIFSRLYNNNNIT